MPAILTDAAKEQEMSAPDSGYEDFLSRLVPPDASKEKPSGEEKKPGPPAKDESAETETEEGSETSAEKPEGEETAEGDGEAETAERKLADEGAYVKIKVGDEEHEVSVKDLQRLYGQEKALTQKSMEVAELRKSADAEAAKNVAATSALLDRAQKRFEPYSKIDFNLAATQLAPEEYTNLRNAALAAYEDVKFLQGNLDGFMQEAQQRTQQNLQTQAKACLDTLSGSVEKGGIEGWSEQLYKDIYAFGKEAGLSSDIMNGLVDPAAYRLLHDAMLFRRGRSKVVTTKVNKTPTKVVKTTQAKEAGQPDKAKADAAKARLLKHGGTDDAAELFLARWSDNDAANQ